MKRPTNRRFIVLALSLVMVAAACSTASDSGETSTTSAPDTSSPAGEVAELTFLAGFTGGDRPVYEQLVAEFNDSHPNIQVTLDIQPWDTIAQTLPAAIAAGGGPDLATPSFQEGSIFEYALNGAILPLDEAYGTGDGKIEKDAMPPAIFDAFSLDGTMYAAPANFATLLLYSNNQLVASPPDTQNAFREASADATAGGIYGVLLAESQTIPMWPILVWANGGRFTDDNGCSALGSAATIAALEPWAQLVAESGVSPVGETGAGTDNLFAAGKGALQMNGPWAAPGYGDAGIEFQLSPVPVGSAGPVTLASSVPIVVNANTEHKDAAFTFLAWWTGKDAQKTLALGSGFPPARIDLADDPDIAAHPVVSLFAKEVPNARIFLSGVVPFAEIAGDVWEPAIARFTRGEPVAEVLTDAAKDMNEILGCS